MRKIKGRPMIDWVVGRTSQISEIEEVVVATSDLNQERPLVEHLRARNVPVYRGSEQDVLSRYAGASEKYGAEAVVRITADCPLIMPSVSRRVIQHFQSEACDYAANTLEMTYPRGLSTEVLYSEVLLEIARKAKQPADREHVTQYIRRRPDQFECCSITAEEDQSHNRWTVDEEADLRFVRRVYEELGERAIEAAYEEVLALLEEQPEIAEINKEVEQKKV
jgi:spore coat polysaccharide biosynthesis protein SpsF